MELNKRAHGGWLGCGKKGKYKRKSRGEGFNDPHYYRAFMNATSAKHNNAPGLWSKPQENL